MKSRMSQIQSRRQIMAPSMQQSIGVLLLPVMDLRTVIEQELQSNPLLEVMEENQNEDSDQRDEALSRELECALQPPDFSYQGNYADDDILGERPIKKEETLEDKLLRQLRAECSDPTELKIGEFVIGNIDEDGYLVVDVEEIALASGFPDSETIERVLSIIRDFDPTGIASRDIKECLLAQVKEKQGHNGNGDLVSRIIRDFLEELGKKKYARIAGKLGVSTKEIEEASRVIAGMEPKPARNSRPVSANIYINPDVFITKNAQGYQTHLNEKDVLPLYINPCYRAMLKKNNLNVKDKEFIREKMKNAILFLKSIRQRGQTIKEIAQYILEKQRGFFDDGHMALVPMSLKDVAGTLNRNESTISRAISNKYIDTPRGIYPVKFFFSQAISCLPPVMPRVGGPAGYAFVPFSESAIALSIPSNGGNNNGVVSNRSIKEEIRELVDTEDRSSPLSDQSIQRYFEHKGMKIARRTINKYRKALKILPSHSRRY